MDLNAWAALSEIVSAIAVVVSLLYLAAQVKQSNRQSASDSGYSIVSEMSRFDEFVFSDPAVSMLLVKMKNSEDLTDEEAIRAEAIADRYINNWYVAENSFHNGTINEGLYGDCVDDAKRQLRTYPLLREHCRSVLEHYRFAQDMKIFATVFEDI